MLELSVDRVFVIAEAGVSHNGSIDMARASSMWRPRRAPMR